MHKDLQKKRNITTKDTIRAMNENGIQISEKEADEILDFLYIIAKLTVNQYINDEGKEEF
ncbi:MAG: hypothetical protein EOO01_31735 [Chitinophagaceae bacterium]|nr:MAG: hypothetical protein EOO01_31735 [Chitinophagaceae bacterium]